MYYEINVAIDGKHYFATAKRSIQSEEKAQKIANELETLYNGHGKVSVTITRIQESGVKIERKVG